MKKLSVLCLTLAMIFSLTTPVLAVNEVAVEEAASNSDVDFAKAYHEGYQLGHADAMAGKAYVETPYVDDSDEPLAKSSGLARSIGYDEGYENAAKDIETAESLKKLGGTNGEINVRLNDKCVAFPDAFPEMKSDRTMVPVRAIMESLGATVESLDNKAVKVMVDETDITLTIGDTEVSVEKDGKTEKFTMEAAPYIKANRTYVPLRFISETIGYEVYWDQGYQSVVILDREAMIAKLNEHYTTLNSFLKTQSKQLEGNWKSEDDISIDLELVDTINGNQKYNITGEATAHTAGGTMAMECSINLGSLMPLMKKLAAATGETDAQNLLILSSLFGKQSFAMKLLPEGDMYIKTGLYDLLFKNLLGVEVDENKETWYSLGNMDPSLFTAEGYNIGNFLYSMQEMQVEYLGAFAAYDDLMQTAKQMEAILGDESFKKQGSSYVWSFDKEKVLSLMEDDAENREMLNTLFEELTLSVKFTERGTYTVSSAIKMNVEGLGALLNMTLEQSGDLSQDKTELEVQVRNLFNLTMKATSRTVQVQTAPDLTIPEDAQIIDLKELLLP